MPETSLGGAARRCRKRPGARAADASRAFDEAVAGDSARTAAELAGLGRALADRQLYFGADPIPTSLKPHFVDKALHDVWVERSEAVFAAIERVGRLLLAEPEL